MRQKLKSYRVAVVLPSYNEAPVIKRVISDIPKVIKNAEATFTLTPVVVDDGSTDNTKCIVEKINRAVLISHIINMGAGAATRTGISYAKNENYDFIITMDSDGQHSTDDVVRLVYAIAKDEADFIIGSRLMERGKGNMPWYKKIGNAGLGLLTYLMLGVYASDTQSGLKALNNRAMHGINFHSNRYAFCSEMIWRAHRAGLEIKEVPIEAIYTDYSISRGQKSLSGALEISSQLFKRRLMDLLNG